MEISFFFSESFNFSFFFRQNLILVDFHFSRLLVSSLLMFIFN